MNKSNILIIGSNSYVGYFLGKYLGLDNNIEYFEKISNLKLDSSFKSIKKIIADFKKYDNIIYLIHDHSNDIDKNLDIINLILKEIKNYQKFIFFSSSQVSENIQNKYTAVKKSIESKIIKENSNFIILRPCLMIDEKITLKKNKEQFLITIIKLIKKYRIALLLANGKFYLNLVSIIDISKLIKEVINKDLKNKIITIYNKESLTLLEIVNFLKSEFKIKIIMIPIPLFFLKLLSKIFPNKISDENLKALKFKPYKFDGKLEKINEINFHKFEDNKSILKKLYDSL
jgi:hypothetical protein